MSFFDDPENDGELPKFFTQEEDIYDDSGEREFDDSGEGEDEGEIPEFFTQEEYIYNDLREEPENFGELSDTDEEGDPVMEQLLEKQRRLEKSRNDYVLKTFTVREFGVVKIRFGKSQWKNARLIRKYKMDSSVKFITTQIKHHTVFIGFTLKDTIGEYSFDIFIYFNTEDDKYFIDSFKEFLSEKNAITLFNKSYEKIYLDLETEEKNYRVELRLPEEYQKVVDSYKFKLKNNILENSRGQKLLVDGRSLPTDTVVTSLSTKHFIINEDIENMSYDKDYIKCKLLNNSRALLVYIKPKLENERFNILRTKNLKLRILDKPSGTKDLEINKASLFVEEYYIYQKCEVQVYNGKWYGVVLYVNKDVYPRILTNDDYIIENPLYVKHEMEGLRRDLKNGMESHAKILSLKKGDPFFVKKGDNNLHIKLEGVDESLLENLYFTAKLNVITFFKRIEADEEGYFGIGEEFEERHLRKGWFSLRNKEFERFSKFSGTLHTGMIAFRDRKSRSKLPSKKSFGKVVFEYFSRD